MAAEEQRELLPRCWVVGLHQYSRLHLWAFVSFHMFPCHKGHHLFFFSNSHNELEFVLPSQPPKSVLPVLGWEAHVFSSFYPDSLLPLHFFVYSQSLALAVEGSMPGAVVQTPAVAAYLFSCLLMPNVEEWMRGRLENSCLQNSCLQLAEVR